MNGLSPRPFLLILATLSWLEGCAAPPRPITVMTRGVYLGADLSPLFSALTAADVTSLTGGIWRDVQTSRFSDRAAVIANEIALNVPDVVSLQEAAIFRTQTPGDWESGAVPNAGKVELDFLQILSDALAARGAPYRIASTGVNADLELPAVALDGTTFDLRVTDRDAILIKEGMTFAPGPSGSFSAFFSISTGGEGGATLSFPRGYVSADITLSGKRVRVVDAHLEVGEQLGRIQEEQAIQLLTALASDAGPMILTGNFNSPPDGSRTQTYALLTTRTKSSLPFRDAWLFRPGQLANSMVTPGGQVFDSTCCIDLWATTPLPQQRIDLVLFRGNVEPVDAAVVALSKAASGLWPSDHLGVLAKLEIR